ncbi:elongation of very long chain fatty acids 2-like [Brachionus plicatilis]|uniref:Elongation of very long chain fatty acids protein n=1 Tax=Brachionus plicatilis TaxID=10195 RepID=A0A3M7STU7_BRAPC|nr:elongation of very long chain fatty acids 2-like [Brachionus plicatilis]
MNETLIHRWNSFYQDALTKTDPRTNNLPLVWNDPRPVLYLVAAYLLMVFLGKRVMSYFPEIKVPSWVLFIYNFGLVLLSAYMFEEIVVGVYQSGYNYACGEINNKPAETKVTKALWWYFFSKAIELLDTFWMIVRKRFNQVTFLHVFHHSTMLIIWWVVISWIPAGQAYFGAALNCVVHVFMYTYYAFSVIPSLKDKLWWKKYITTFQLAQFVITFSHTLNGMYLTMSGKCSFPMWGQILLSSYMVIMLALFTNFYVHEYIKKTNDAKRRRNLKDLNNNVVKTDKKKFVENKQKAKKVE